MSELNKSLVRRFYQEVENQGKLDLIEELFDPNFQDVYNLVLPFQVRGHEGVRQLVTFLQGLRAPGGPGLTITIEDLIAEGDKVVARLSSGQTVDSPGGRVTSQFIEIFRVENGKLVERWVFIDRGGHT